MVWGVPARVIPVGHGHGKRGVGRVSITAAYWLGRRGPAARALTASGPGSLLLQQQLGAETVERWQVLGRRTTRARRACEEGHRGDLFERDRLRGRALGAEEALEMVDQPLWAVRRVVGGQRAVALEAARHLVEREAERGGCRLHAWPKDLEGLLERRRQAQQLRFPLGEPKPAV